jgi:hypothetical protein
LDTKQLEIDAKQTEIDNVQDDISTSQTRGGYTDADGIWHSQNSTSQSSSENTAAKTALREEKARLTAGRDEFAAMLAEVTAADSTRPKLFNSYRAVGDRSLTDTALRLYDESANGEESAAAYERFGAQLTKLQSTINGILAKAGLARFEIVELSEVKRVNTQYEELLSLALPDFSRVRESVDAEHDSIYDRLFAAGAEMLDSNFVADAVDLKERAEALTETQYAALTEAAAGLTEDDPELAAMVYGGDMDDEAVPPLKIAKDRAVYRDALSQAMGYLAIPGIETYSRVLYACLADGLVLLIGFSLRRRRGTVYRARNRRELKREEPRLMAAALRGLAARDVILNGEERTGIAALVAHLQRFMGYFEIEPFLRSEKPKENFSMICRNAVAAEQLNMEYKEFLNLLITLQYIRPVTAGEYGEMTKAQVKIGGGEYFYLMTEGFTLYFAEKVSALQEYGEKNKT